MRAADEMRPDRTGDVDVVGKRALSAQEAVVLLAAGRLANLAGRAACGHGTRLPRHILGCEFNRQDDVLVSRASAHIARKRVTNLVAAGVRVLVE